MKILIKFPTRNRPDKFIQNFLKYQHMVSGNHDIRFIVSMDSDDPTMNCDRIKGFLNKQKNVKYFYGNSKTKIEAINADLTNLEPFDVIMLASDDMIPITPSYDEIIASDMKRLYPDLDGVLHYNDGRAGERLNTFCIMGKKYFDRFGYFYHPSYQSVYCDNEFTDISRFLGKATYSERVLFQHGWIEYVGFDALAQRNESVKFYEVDKKNYEDRKVRNFEVML